MELIFWNIFQKILHTMTNREVIVIAVTVAADGLKACSSKNSNSCSTCISFIDIIFVWSIEEELLTFFQKIACVKSEV